MQDMPTVRQSVLKTDIQINVWGFDTSILRQYASIAQSAEQVTLNHKVGGSRPLGCTTEVQLANKLFCLELSQNFF